MKQKPAIFIILILLSSSTVFSQTGEEAKNINKVRSYWEEVWRKGNLKAVEDFYHPHAKHGQDFTIEGFQKGVQSQRDAIPDFNVTINDIFATGDKVISEVTYFGTHTGRRFFGQDPLGKKISAPGIDIFTFKDGKCISHQHVADHLPVIRKLV
jgi:predicted ester cyclase